MVELKFFSDINFESFTEDARSEFGSIPGEVDAPGLRVRIPWPEFAQREAQLRELVRDYGGSIFHRKV